MIKNTNPTLPIASLNLTSLSFFLVRIYLTNKPIIVKPNIIKAIYLLNKGTSSNFVFKSVKKVVPKASDQEIEEIILINNATPRVVTKGHTLAFLSSFSSSYKKNTSSVSSSSCSFLSCNFKVITTNAIPITKNNILAINKSV